MTEFIRCCPFCGGHAVAVNRTHPNACWISCDVCNGRTESTPSRKKAIALWNRRYYDDKPSTIVYDDEIAQ